MFCPPLQATQDRVTVRTGALIGRRRRGDQNGTRKGCGEGL